MPQRSPVIFWLLVAATLAVDAVAISWLRRDTNQIAAGTFWDALAFSQLSVIAIWWSLASHKRGRALWAWIVLPIAIAIVALITSRIYEFPLREASAVYGTDVALVAVMLWIVKQLTGFRPITTGDNSPNWQFSVGQLLGLMTVVALIVGSLQETKFLRYAWGDFAIAVFTSSLTATAAATIWLRRSTPFIGLVSLATLLATALILGVIVLISVNVVEYTVLGSVSRVPPGPYPINPPFPLAGTIIQCLVIFFWLAVGRIIPDTADSADGCSTP